MSGSVRSLTRAITTAAIVMAAGAGPVFAGQGPAPRPVASHDRAEAGKALYTTACANCHGVDASGDGALAAQAGCQFDYGREGNGETQPMSLLAWVTGINDARVAARDPVKGRLGVLEDAPGSFVKFRLDTQKQA